jgi:hypothetical protein
MKFWKIISGFALGTFLILIGLLIIPWATDASWWWFGGSLIAFFILWIFAIIILLIINKKPKVKTAKISLRDGQDRAIYEMKYDNDNPDNFRVDKKYIAKIGVEGSEKTPIGVYIGKGTELNQDRVFLINLNEPKKESSSFILKNTTDQEAEIREKIILLADNQPEEIQEKVTQQDSFGNVIAVRETRRPNSRKAQEEKENKEAEEANAT